MKIFLLVFFLCTHFVLAQSKQNVHFAFLEDHAGKLTVQDITKPEIQLQFKSSPSSLFHFQLSNSWYWIRIEVSNTNIIKPLLILEEPKLEYCHLHYQDAQGTWQVIKNGYHLSRKQKYLQQINQVFPLLLRGERTVFYLQVQGNAQPIPLKIESESAFLEAQTFQNLAYGLFYGLMFFIALNNLALGFLTRSPAYFAYAGGVLSYVGASACLSGYAKLWADIDLILHIQLFGSFSLVCMTLYAQYFLDIRRQDKSYVVIQMLLGLSVVLFTTYFFIKPLYSAPLTQGIALITLISCLGLAIFSLKAGKAFTRYYLLAFVLFACMVVFQVLQANTGYPPHFYISHAEWGWFFEVTILAFALNRKFEYEKHALELANEQARQENLRLVQEQNAILEQRVAERTQALEEANHELQSANEELQAGEEELKQNAEELLAINENLNHTLHELKETQNQLIHSEKMASLGQLVASVAHEINTPLGAIRSSVESNTTYLVEALDGLPAFLDKLNEDEKQTFFQTLHEVLYAPITHLSTREKRQIRNQIQQRLEEQSIEKAHEIADFTVEMGIQFDLLAHEVLCKTPHLFDIMDMMHKITIVQRGNQNIQTATERASKIIFALKNFSRQDHAGEKTPTNLNESIETVLTLYYNQIKQGIEVIRNFGNLSEIPCYQDEIIQVWTNLIHNALHAMAGKGTLTIETKQQDNQIIVSIQDTGIGVAPEIQDKIFNAFFTTKPQGEGSGLGLDIVRKIIDKHAGKIWFETEAGKGTTFFVQIPTT